MSARRKLSTLASAAGAVALSAAVCTSLPAAAATTTTTMAVAATVVSVCVVVATPLVFGDYLATAPAPTDATSSIQVLCNQGTSFDVALDAGQNSTDVTTRAMKNAIGTGSLAYALYLDAARSQNWGNTSGTDTASGTSDGSLATLTVNGRIVPGLLTAPTGAYTDVVTVTVTF